MSSTAARASLDRLGVTLLFSLVAHAVLALGLTFDFEEPAPRLPALDVTLIQSANEETPEQADFLAQASNSGGGEDEHAHRPAERHSGPLQADGGVAPVPLEDGAPRPADAAPMPAVTGASPEFEAPTSAQSAPAEDSLLPEADAEQRRLEMARLAQEIRQQSEQYAKRPRRKYLSANTREYAWAAYMRAWVARVERIGNLNYPDEARRRQLHGQLVLTVGLRRDGTVHSIDVIQSSGHAVLDDAALRIVRLAEPFPPLPDNAETVDELYISRTWQFLPGDILRNR